MARPLTVLAKIVSTGNKIRLRLAAQCYARKKTEDIHRNKIIIIKKRFIHELSSPNAIATPPNFLLIVIEGK